MDPSCNWKQLYTNWLKDLSQSAQNNTRATYLTKNYDRAAKSVSSAEITTETPNQLSKLGGVGKKTIEILTKKALQHCKDNDLSIEWYEATQRASPAASTTATPATARKSTREYVPKFGSTTYHVLVGLRQLEKTDQHGAGFGKDAILRHIKPKLMGGNGGHQKIVPSLTPAFNQLIKHGLIFSRSRQYFLEQKGRDLAKGFMGVEKDSRENEGEIVSSEQPTPNRHTAQHFSAPDQFDSHVWQPHEYTVHFLLDNREVSTSGNRSGFQEALEELKIPTLVLPLSVGDCCWVIEHKTSRRRAVLDTIVERKRLDDLVSSIIDGRFLEQKRRLEKTGLPNIVYLVEFAAGDIEFREKHEQRIKTACSQVLAHHSFHYFETESQKETVCLLQQLTESLKDSLKDKPITVIHPNIAHFEVSMNKAITSAGGSTSPYAIDYDSFVEATTKQNNKTIGEVFTLMLMSINGISPEKAFVIQDLFKTPRGLIEAYKKAPASARPLMLYEATIDLPIRRGVSEEISQLIYEQWGSGTEEASSMPPPSMIPSGSLAKSPQSPASPIHASPPRASVASPKPSEPYDHEFDVLSSPRDGTALSPPLQPREPREPSPSYGAVPPLDPLPSRDFPKHSPLISLLSSPVAHVEPSPVASRRASTELADTIEDEALRRFSTVNSITDPVQSPDLEAAPLSPKVSEIIQIDSSPIRPKRVSMESTASESKRHCDGPHEVIDLLDTDSD